MKPSLYALAALLVAAGWAVGQPPPKPAAPGGTPLVLLLDDFRIVEGTVERVGDAYRVRKGKEVHDYPAKQVLFAGDSQDAVRRYLMSRAATPRAAKEAAPGGLNSAAVRAFPTRVQPVLMNLCANCHGRPDHPGGFRLARVPEGFANAEAAGRNAEAVARYVRRDDPSASPLLEKLATAHGGQRTAAVHNRSHPAYRNLELWAHWAAGPEGSAMPAGVPVVAKPAAAPVPQPVPAAPAPATPASEDPFDPAVFNRAMHPGR